MMKPIVLYPVRTALFTAAVLLSSCDEGSSGLQQRLIEVEAQRDMQSQKVTELQSRLNSLTEKPAAPVAGTASPSTPAASAADNADHAMLIATASGLGDELAKEMPGGRLETFGLTQMVGFKLVKADGFTSVVVPFFSKGDGYWECGWSKDRIKAALQSKDGVIATSAAAPAQPVAAAPAYQPTPPPVTQASPPPAQPAQVMTQPQTQPVYQPPSAPAPVVLSTSSPNNAALDGVTLQPGERIVTLTDLDGNPQRAVRKADGTIRVIFK